MLPSQPLAPLAAISIIRQTRVPLTKYWFYVTNKLAHISEQLRTGAVRRSFLFPQITFTEPLLARVLRGSPYPATSTQECGKEKAVLTLRATFQSPSPLHLFLSIFEFLLHPDSHRRFPYPPAPVWSTPGPSP